MDVRHLAKIIASFVNLVMVSPYEKDNVRLAGMENREDEAVYFA